MATNIGYERALRLAREELAGRDPALVAGNTGVPFENGEYVIPWLGRRIPLSEGAVDQQIIWHHYLCAQGPRQPRGRLIAYRQIPGAGIYNANFYKRSIQPMVRAFGGNLAGFLAAGQALGGEAVSHGDAAFTLHPLPYLPLTYVVWQGDDEMPANGNILFDESAIEWLCAEDLVVLAGLPVYEMLRMQNGPKTAAPAQTPLEKPEYFFRQEKTQGEDLDPGDPDDPGRSGGNP